MWGARGCYALRSYISYLRCILRITGNFGLKSIEFNYSILPSHISVGFIIPWYLENCLYFLNDATSGYELFTQDWQMVSCPEKTIYYQNLLWNITKYITKINRQKFYKTLITRRRPLVSFTWGSTINRLQYNSNFSFDVTSAFSCW